MISEAQVWMNGEETSKVASFLVNEKKMPPSAQGEVQRF